MLVLPTSLRAILLVASIIDAVTVANGTITVGTNVRAAVTSAVVITAAASIALSATADARMSAEDDEKGFVSEVSKHTYHEKLALFVQ